MRLRTISLTALALCSFWGCSHILPQESGMVPLTMLSESQREDYLRRAVVWLPIDTEHFDVRKGPPTAGLEAGSVLACDFVRPEVRPLGRTAKFLCRTSGGRVYKVKYGRDNPELYAEVIGTRLLWALGFRADRVDPVEVHCRGCPDDPWAFMQYPRWHGLWDDLDASQVRVFMPAVVETYYGKLLEAEDEQGVAWDEMFEFLDRDPMKAEVQRVHREALTLLASFLQYADSKPSNQSLACRASSGRRGKGRCREPRIYLGDLGGILGKGWTNIPPQSTKVNFDYWSGADVWRDREHCVTAVDGQPNATLHDTAISEQGRAFLAGRLALLRREQLREIFTLSRFELLGEELEDEKGHRRAVTADDWADLFVRKSREITEHVCPPGPLESSALQ